MSFAIVGDSHKRLDRGHCVARLPQTGGDSGNWGTILNDYLLQAHDANGSLKQNTVGSAQLQTDSVKNDSIANGSITDATPNPSGDATT